MFPECSQELCRVKCFIVAIKATVIDICCKRGRVCVCVCVCVYICIYVLSHVCLFATPSTVARQAPLSMGFSRQEYWSELSCPLAGDLPNTGIEPRSLIAGGFFAI